MAKKGQARGFEQVSPASGSKPYRAAPAVAPGGILPPPHPQLVPPRSASVLWPLPASLRSWQRLKKCSPIAFYTADVFWRKSVLHTGSYSKLAVILTSGHLD